MVDTHRRAAIGQSNTLMLHCFACHVTVMLQLLRKANKLLLAYVIFLNVLIFSNTSTACVKEYLIAAMY